MMPIDPDFQKKLKPSGDHNGHKVWGETAPPTKLGIHGTKVAVDWDLCNGDKICIDVCPTNVFELLDTPGHPTSEKKSDPIREGDCIFCRACEVQCPAQAILITE